MSLPQKRRVSLGAISSGNKRLNSHPDDSRTVSRDLLPSLEDSEEQKRVLRELEQPSNGVDHVNCVGRVEELDCSSSCAESDEWETDKDDEADELSQTRHLVPPYIFRCSIGQIAWLEHS